MAPDNSYILTRNAAGQDNRSGWVIPRTSSSTALTQGIGCLLDQTHRVFGVQGGSEQPVKCKGIAAHVRSRFKVEVPSQGLEHESGLYPEPLSDLREPNGEPLG